MNKLNNDDCMFMFISLDSFDTDWYEMLRASQWNNYTYSHYTDYENNLESRLWNVENVL